jgi:hypothetical protein
MQPINYVATVLPLIVSHCRETLGHFSLVASYYIAGEVPCTVALSHTIHSLERTGDFRVINVPIFFLCSAGIAMPATVHKAAWDYYFGGLLVVKIILDRI